MGKIKTIKALSLGEGISVLVSFLLLPYLSRSLPVDVYGSYGQILFFVDIFKALAMVGLNKVIFIYLSSAENETKVFSNNIFASFIMGLLAWLLCCMFAPIISLIFKNESILWPIIIYSFSIPFQIAFTCYSSLLVFKAKSRLLSIVSVVSNLLRYIFILVVLHFTKDILLLFIATLSAFIIQFIFIFFYSKISISFKYFDIRIIKKQVLSGIPLGLTSIIGVLYYLSDSMVVSTLLNPEDYATLRNGAFQIPFISTIYGIVGMSMMPDIGNFLAKNESLKVVEIIRKASSMTALFIIPPVLFLIAFAYIIIPFLFSDLYLGSIVIFMIYNIITLFRIMDYEGVIILSQQGNKLPRIYFFSLTINIILSIPLTLMFGIVGASVATVLSFLYLMFNLISLNLAILSVHLRDLFDFNFLFGIIKFCFLPGIVVYSFFSITTLNPFLAILLIGLGLLLVYHLLLKSKLFTQVQKIEVINLIPHLQLQFYLKKFYI